MKLRKGMIVNYHPTPTECGKMREHRSTCNISEELPAVVVHVHSDDVVNLKVLLDGVGDLWATEVKSGDGVGEWDFYPEESEFRGVDGEGSIDLLDVADFGNVIMDAKEVVLDIPEAKLAGKNVIVTDRRVHRAKSNAKPI